MKAIKKIEFLILIILWILSITTYSLAYINGYSLYNSDYLGIIGLLIVSVFLLIRPDKALETLMLLLFLGLLNLISFVYFFNIVLTFGISGFVTPGIQLLSLILLTILIVKRRKKVFEIYQSFFGITENEKEKNRYRIKESFKTNFENLTDEEIDMRLQENLVPEAKEALTEIKNERKTYYNIGYASCRK